MIRAFSYCVFRDVLLFKKKKQAIMLAILKLFSASQRVCQMGHIF